MSQLFFFLFFCVLAVVLLATAVGWNFVEAQRRRQVKNVLRSVDGKDTDPIETDLLSDPAERDDILQRFVTGSGIGTSLQTTLQQSGLNWPLSQLLIAMGVCAAVGLFVGWKFNFLLFTPISALAFAVAGGLLPLLYVRFKRRRRFADFEEQFPEALDFLARSMRAGHAFSISLEMLGQESPEPLGMEFRALFNEQNLGAPLEVAFANMLRRLPLVDVRFFVSSVMLQRQTGGNLSEILVRLSYIIRERFRLKGQVKAASAHGRMTAGILTIMPIVLMFALLFVAPGYLQSMAKDPDGKYLILAAVIAQLLGYFFIRKIIRIKV